MHYFQVSKNLNRANLEGVILCMHINSIVLLCAVSWTSVGLPTTASLSWTSVGLPTTESLASTCIMMFYFLAVLSAKDLIPLDANGESKVTSADEFRCLIVRLKQSMIQGR